MGRSLMGFRDVRTWLESPIRTTGIGTRKSYILGGSFVWG